jgi:hypothetical protein
MDEKLFFHLLDWTIMNSLLILTSCGAKVTHRDFRLTQLRNWLDLTSDRTHIGPRRQIAFVIAIIFVPKV